MPDTRYTLLGKLCVWAVRATDDQLRSALRKGGWKGLSITKRKSKRGGYGTIKLKRKILKALFGVLFLWLLKSVAYL